LCDFNYNIIESNRAADFILNQGEKISNKKCYKLLRGQKKTCPDCPLKATIQSGKIIPHSYFDRRFDEYFEERIYPVVAKQDINPESFVLMCRNVTDIKSHENKSAQLKKLSALGKISSGVAHDFNNMLTIVLGRIQSMRKHIDNPKVLRDLEMMEKSAFDGAEKVKKIQDFARHDKDELKTLIDLYKLINEVVELSEPKWEKDAESKGILIKPILNLEENLYINGNPSDLRNAFANIIFNAVDAMPDGGLIKISSYSDNQFVFVNFEDTGMGMTEEIMDKIFDPFFTTKGAKGTGMGMSEVYGIIKRHEGTINITSSIGLGTTMKIKIPKRKIKYIPASDEENVVIADSNVIENKSLKEHTPIKILIISEKGYDLTLIQELLSDLGYNVTTCNSYKNSINLFRKERFNIVFSDLGEPTMKGMATAQIIRNIKRNTITVLLSGLSLSQKEVHVFERSFNFTITKPFTKDKIKFIMQEINNLLKSGKN